MLVYNEIHCPFPGASKRWKGGLGFALSQLLGHPYSFQLELSYKAKLQKNVSHPPLPRANSTGHHACVRQQNCLISADGPTRCWRSDTVRAFEQGELMTWKASSTGEKDRPSSEVRLDTRPSTGPGTQVCRRDARVGTNE